MTQIAFDYDVEAGADAIDTALTLLESYELDDENVAAAVRLLGRSAVDAHTAAADAQEAAQEIFSVSERGIKALGERYAKLATKYVTLVAAYGVRVYQVSDQGVVEPTI